LETLKGTGQPHHRIGTVSKLTGIPVSTLRIWEIRYSAFSPIQSAGKHRLFENADIRKATLLKRLNEAGHAVRAIAHLSVTSLELLSQQAQASSSETRDTLARPMLLVAVVGSGVAERIDSENLLARSINEPIELSDHFLDLNSALSGVFRKRPDMLIVQINTLNSSTREQIDILNARLGLKRTIVLYNYGSSALLLSMRNAGMLLRRQAITEDDLIDLVRSEIFVDPLRTAISPSASIAIPDRVHSDAVLSRVASISTSILCECPKHVAELISQLASFEEYSQDCLSKSTEDAQLHAYLKSVSGSARALFERALERVAKHEGISLLA
jgi:MerR family transcriptional regulator, light-induced transcriptional regulator